MRDYWRNEQPIVFDDERLTLRYFFESKKLSIERKPFKRQNGTEKKRGSLTLNVDYLKKLPKEQRIILEEIFSDIAETVAVRPVK